MTVSIRTRWPSCSVVPAAHRPRLQPVRSPWERPSTRPPPEKLTTPPRRRLTHEASLWKPPEQTATTSKSCRSGTKPPSRNPPAT
uniref:Uncharacterized protein n=1 Tax=uncultured marine virus TaxID=186617 RepID=A0A0F7LAM1_9VIRU|nr:hypothetical protein [uncultured marine virus]